jgi:hypothetical protein
MRTVALLLVAGVAAGWAAPARADILYGLRPTDVVVATGGDDFSFSGLTSRSTGRTRHKCT